MNEEQKRTPLSNNRSSFPTKQQVNLKEQALNILKTGQWNSPAGIDKIRIQCPPESFNITDITKWEIAPNRKKQTELFPIDTPLVRVDDEIITGEKMYHNSSQATGYEDTENISYSLNGYGLSVEFNPSKQKGLAYGKLAGIGDVKEVIENVIKYGNDIGISFPSYQEMKLSRVDYAMDREMDLQVHQYGCVWNRIEMKRSNKRAEFPSGFYTGNGMREFNCYDKGAESEKYLPHSKYMRIEYRALKTKTNKSSGVTTISDLLQWSDADIQKHYRQTIRKDLFKIKEETYQMLDFDDEVSMIQKLFETGSKRNSIRKWIMCYGLDAILSRHENRWKDIENIITSTELFNRSTVWKQIEEMKQLNNSMRSKSKRYTLIEKYNELTDKFAA